MTLAAPEHQETNGKVEVTRRTLRTVAQSLMVYARVSEACVHFALMYTTDHIFLVLPIKYIINEDGDPTTPHKLATFTKPSVSHLCVLFLSYLSGSTNQRSYKRAWRSNNATQTGNRYKTFSITFTHVIFYVCCTEIYGAR